MQYAVDPDIGFLADALVGLTKLNIRHFRNDLNLAHVILRRMLRKEYKWIREKPDTWQDVVQMADPEQCEFDCEDFSAALAALMVICFGTAKVGIRCVEHECHALAGDSSNVYDLSPIFGMRGKSQGAGEWRTIKDKPMIAEGIALLTTGVRRLMAESREAPTSAAQLQTGGVADALAAMFPPAAHARINDLTNERDALKRQVAALRIERTNLQKERDALKKNLVEMTESRNACSADLITAKTKADSTQKQLAEESSRLAEARAFHSACKEQLQAVLARSPDESAKKLAQEGLDRLNAESPDTLAASFQDDQQRAQAWQMLETGAAHIANLADCDACRRGEPCTRTGEADAANGDEPPDVGGPPDSNDFVNGLDGPPSSSPTISLSDCGGSCPPR